MDTDEGFEPGNAAYNNGLGFNMAFGLKSGKPLDPRIGSWSIQYIIKKLGEMAIVEDQPLTLCGTVCDKNEDEFDSCGWKHAEGLDVRKYYCSDVFKKNIRGDPYSKDYRYIKITMKKCKDTPTFKCHTP